MFDISFPSLGADLLLAAFLLLNALALGSAVHALLHKREVAAALGWIGIILLIPPLGLPFYWLFGIARSDSRAARLMQEAADLAASLSDLPFCRLPPEAGPEGGEEALSSHLSAPGFPLKIGDGLLERLRRLSRPGQRLAARALTGGNAIRPLYNGESAYAAMLEAVEGARERVWLSTFIFDDDAVGAAFAGALSRAAARGCDARLLVDGVGSFRIRARWPRLAKGVRLARFLPPALFPPRFSLNLRTHRKVLVCDSRLAFTGGMNISATHLGARSGPKVQDVHFRCEGPIATHFEGAFLMDWHLATAFAVNRGSDPAAPLVIAAPCRRGRPCPPDEERRPGSSAIASFFKKNSKENPDIFRQNFKFSTASSRPEEKDSGWRADAAEGRAGEKAAFCRLIMDGPGHGRGRIQDLVCAMIASATTSIRIMSPYFLPPAPLAGALVSASLRGVDLSIIVPYRCDHRLVDWAMRHQLPHLARVGLPIFSQPPPFAHTKLLLVDGLYTLLGSANLDPRSLNLNFELVMEVLDENVTGELTRFYDDVLARSRPIGQTPPPFPRRLLHAASWLLSPYL